MHSNGGFEADTFGDVSKSSAGFNGRRSAGFRTTELNGDFGNFEPTGKKPEMVTNDAEFEDGEEELQQKSGTKRCLKRFSSLMLSHLGTFLLVLLYVLMGGFLFWYLEVENEISSCKTLSTKYIDKLDESVDRIYNMAQGSNATQSKVAILEELNEFAQDIYTLGVDPSMNCSTLNTADNMPNWNVANAAYFCVTIITTIGYGHISPVTQWGQIVCMIYSILGIPLMLLFLSKIGEPTAMLFRSFYLNIFCCKCFVKKLPHENKLMEALKENGGNAQTTWQQVEEGDGKRPPAKVTVIEDDPDEEEEEDEEEDVVNIPITVTIILLILYILMGAAVFLVWEKDWSLVEGTYFSFITLSTIGFGDYVPGRNGPFNDMTVITELIVGCIYCIFGLAMLSMCINLIQDEMQAKFQWLGRKIGMIKKVPLEELEEDEEDGEDDSGSSSGSGSGSGSDSGEDAFEDAKSSKTSSSAAPTSGRSKAASSSFA